MLTQRLHHVSLSVSDIDRSRKFYGELLGLPEIERPEMGIPGAWFGAGPAELHLIQPPPNVDVGSPAPGLNPLGRHTAFAIEDYAAALAFFQKQGLEVLETSPERGQMWIRDPDGNLLEFIREA